jgi:hypothetical protein
VVLIIFAEFTKHTNASDPTNHFLALLQEFAVLDAELTAASNIKRNESNVRADYLTSTL